MKTDRLYSIYLHTVIGDALGTPLEGLGKSHIHSTLKSLSGYTDPSAALKGKMFKWRKPALYSSISQLLILFSMHSIRGAFPLSSYADAVANTPESPDSKLRIFRFPDNITENFLLNAGSSESAPVSGRPGAHTVPLMIHLCLDSRSRDDAMLKACSLAGYFTDDISTAAGSMIYTGIIRDALSAGGTTTDSLRAAALESAMQSISFIESNSPAIFAAGINPDTLHESALLYRKALDAVNTGTGIDAVEKKLVEILNSILKTPVTRATVNHPLAIIPYSLCLASFYGSRPGEAILRIVEEGGSTAALGSCAGSFLGLFLAADDIPSQLTDDLVNRKRITTVIEAIANRKISGPLIDEFVSSELSLTSKAWDEFRARTKKHQDIPVETEGQTGQS